MRVRRVMVVMVGEGEDELFFGIPFAFQDTTTGKSVMVNDQ